MRTWPRPNVPGPGVTIPALDGIRGIAIVLVLLFHAFQSSQIVFDTSQHPSDRLIHRAAMAGWTGVDLFFVLSGFLITRILYAAKESTNYFRAFYIRRLVRIFPLYYAALAFYFLVLPAIFPENATLHAAAQNQFWGWTYLSNIGVVVLGWGVPSPYLNHFWSLAVEEQFYLLWPLVVFALARRTIMNVCVGMIGVSLALRVLLFALGEDATAAYVLTPMRMDALAVGAWLALAIRDPTMRWRLTARVRPVCFALSVSLLGLFVWRGGLDAYDPVTGTIGLTLLAVFYGSLVFVGTTSPPGSRVARILASSPLRVLGKYSYGLYVFHWPVILFLGETGLLVRLLPPGPGMSAPRQLLFAVLALTISFAIAFPSWHLYEKHFLKLKARAPYLPDQDKSRTPPGTRSKPPLVPL